MARGGGSRPARGGPTLGQATGGRPAPVKRGLGLGLGLNPQQRGQFQAQAQRGQGTQFLANHPGIAQRVNRVNPTSQRATRIQNFMGTGQSQKPPRPPTTRPQAPGARRQQPQFGGMFAPVLPPQHPLMQSVNPGMQSVINSRMGQGWSGDNAAMQGQLGQQAGNQSEYAIGSGYMGPSFGPGGPYGGASGYGTPGLGSRAQLGGFQMNVPVGYGGTGGAGNYRQPAGGMATYDGGGMFGSAATGQMNPNWNQPQTGPRPQQTTIYPSSPGMQQGRYGPSQQIPYNSGQGQKTGFNSTFNWQPQDLMGTR